MQSNENEKNRGAHGDSLRMLDEVSSSNKNLLDFRRGECQKPVYFRTIANWFPGEAEEAELFRRLRLLVEGGFVRRTENGKFEVVK